MAINCMNVAANSSSLKCDAPRIITAPLAQCSDSWLWFFQMEKYRLSKYNMQLNSYMVTSRCIEKRRIAEFAAGNSAHRSRIGLEIGCW